MMKCPDEGTCHHDCKDVCWRVSACGPLSGVFPNDRWPAEVVRLHTRDSEASPHPRCKRPNCEEHEFPGLYGCMGCAGHRTEDKEAIEEAERIRAKYGDYAATVEDVVRAVGEGVVSEGPVIADMDRWKQDVKPAKRPGGTLVECPKCGSVQGPVPAEEDPVTCANCGEEFSRLEGEGCLHHYPGELRGFFESVRSSAVHAELSRDGKPFSSTSNDCLMLADVVGEALAELRRLRLVVDGIVMLLDGFEAHPFTDRSAYVNESVDLHNLIRKLIEEGTEGHD